MQTALPDATNLLVLGMDTGSNLKLYEGEFDQAGLEISNPLAFSQRLIPLPSPPLCRALWIERWRSAAGLHPARHGEDFTVRGFLQDHRRQR